MTSRLLNLAYELRFRIYEYVLLSQGPAHVIPSESRAWKTPGAPGWKPQRHHHPVEPKYPPSTGSKSGEAKSTPPSQHLLVRNNGTARDLDLWQYALSFHDGELTVGPNLMDGEIEEGWSDEEDESDVESGDEDDASDLGSDNEDDYHRARRSGYKVEPLRPLDLNLLLVNRQINSEATSIFYSGATFVPDADPVDTLRFFKALPDRALQNITNITFTTEHLLGDDGPSRACWFGDASKPLTKGCPAMVTPMCAFLVTYMPKLTDVYLYTPIYGNEDWYCSWAPIELCKLLCHGEIQRLHYIFMGEKVANVLRTVSDSQKCFEWLFDQYLPGNKTAQHEFALRYPTPKYKHSKSDAEHERKREKLLARWDREEKYMKEHSELIAWKWGDRDIHMGSSGSAQAVVTTWMK